LHRSGLVDLLTTEPPVVFIRVVLPVIEAPFRRGFAFSHMTMLSLSRHGAAGQALSLQVRASKCRCVKGFGRGQ
jgi:hypothetical protein